MPGLESVPMSRNKQIKFMLGKKPGGHSGTQWDYSKGRQITSRGQKKMEQIKPVC